MSIDKIQASVCVLHGDERSRNQTYAQYLAWLARKAEARNAERNARIRTACAGGFYNEHVVAYYTNAMAEAWSK